jgi:transcriptional regulator with XRE-family HTH domain
MATQANHQIATVVGANILLGRDAKGMTQQELATELGTSISRVSGWENGKHLPRNPQAVADVLFDGDLMKLYRAPDPEAAAA